MRSWNNKWGKFWTRHTLSTKPVRAKMRNNNLFQSNGNVWGASLLVLYFVVDVDCFFFSLFCALPIYIWIYWDIYLSPPPFLYSALLLLAHHSLVFSTIKYIYLEIDEKTYSFAWKDLCAFPISVIIEIPYQNSPHCLALKNIRFSFFIQCILVYLVAFLLFILR